VTPPNRYAPPSQRLRYSGGFFNGLLDDANNILDVSHFQMQAWFGAPFRSDNPIDLFHIRWTPATYAPRTATLDNGGPDAYIYTDYWGNYLLYSDAGGSVTFHVVPAPGSAAALLAAAALSVSRRRR